MKMPSVKRLTAVRLDQTLHDAISERARADSRSVSNYIETILRDHVFGRTVIPHGHTVDWALKAKDGAIDTEPPSELEQRQLEFLRPGSMDEVTVAGLRKNAAFYAERFGADWPT